ncbi:hypothetical protein [Flavobacterium tegetincola]|uniref:hypothetical protein n=1 Tax=Flavobacterium tegetincola TaxID=150172 RepID=UPI000425C396|nr:hypothetical protein [Flavobacterium tegetincola]
MIKKDHVNNFSATLKRILDKEITLGNKIVETSEGWPHANSIMVFLEKPFFQKYQLEKIEYRHINDPHYWKEEYFDGELNHTLACKF